MSTSSELLDEIEHLLGPTLLPSLTSASRASDLYQAYLFATVCNAATAEGATVRFRSIQSNTPAQFVFRTSPGLIGSTTHDYGYAVIEFEHKPPLEAHVGIRISGGSKVLHECDICVLFSREATRCRAYGLSMAPRASKVVLFVEAKFYTSHIGLLHGRAFLGLTADCGKPEGFFVINRTSASIEKLLANKHKKWDHNIQPQNVADVNRLRNVLQSVFKDFKAEN